MTEQWIESVDAAEVPVDDVTGVNIAGLDIALYQAGGGITPQIIFAPTAVPSFVTVFWRALQLNVHFTKVRLTYVPVKP